jgi:di/tricarboxylate transporter
MVIFTGGGFPILASQLISDYNVADLEWLEWFLMIAPPLWLASGLMVLFVWGFLRYTLPKEKIIRGNRTDTSADEKNEEPLTIKFWVVLLSFLIMVVTWIITDQGQVPLLLPPLLLIAFYSLPRLGLVTNEMIRSYDWETFLLLGASFSLGMLLDDNGTAEELANVLLNMIPEHAGMVVNIIIITLIVAVLRFFFIVPSAAMIVIFPIVISYSELMGIAPVQLSFLVVLVIGSMMILPIHTATTYLAFETGILSKREQYVMGFVSTVIYITIAVLAAIYFW